MHYPSDVLASQRLAAAVAKEVIASPQWQSFKGQVQPEVQKLLVAPPLACRCSPIERRWGLGLQQGKAAGDLVAGELGHPAFAVVEETQGGELGFCPHVKPVAGAGGHADPIVAFAEHLQHLFRFSGMDAEEAPAFHKETHLVFGVDVFRQKLLAQGNALGMVGVDADRIYGAVAPSACTRVISGA